jgi:hypothetical protein
MRAFRKFLTKPGLLLSFSAICFLAVGAPLVHPFFHQHSCRLEHFGHHSARPSWTAAAIDTSHECPICAFLATAQHSILTAGTELPIFDPLSGELSPPWSLFPGNPEERLFGSRDHHSSVVLEPYVAHLIWTPVRLAPAKTYFREHRDWNGGAGGA